MPPTHTEMSWLRYLAEEGATRRYGPRHDERVPGAWAQIDHELEVIEQLGFPGYFLIVWDIVEFCRRSNILCQGRGSAANSAVCYALGITNADAVNLGLLFERFLSPERDGPPDIDLDIEHQRREEVIQHVYERHGRERAALVANVITYRARSAIRETTKAVGLSPGQADAISRFVDRWGGVDASGWGGPKRRPDARTPSFDGLADPGAPPVPELALDLARRILDFPRHLGIHPGGMVPSRIVYSTPEIVPATENVTIPDSSRPRSCTRTPASCPNSRRNRPANPPMRSRAHPIPTQRA